MQLSGWLIYDAFEAKRNEAYINKYMKAAFKQSVELKLIIADNLISGTDDKKSFILYEGKEVELPGFVINRTGDGFLGSHLESLALSVYNSSEVTNMCTDKRRSMHIALSAGLDVMPSLFFRSWSTKPNWEYLVEKIGNSSEESAFVLKPVNGKGGKNVMLVSDELQYKRALVTFDKTEDIIIQKAASDLGKDLRIYLMGRHIVASMLRKSDPLRDFRSNYCLGGEASVYNLSHSEKALVKRITDRYDFGLVGIDFIFNNNSLVFNEIEDVVGSRMLYSMTDIDIADMYIEYIIKDMHKKWIVGS